MNPEVIKVSRNGSEIGAFPLPDVLRMLGDGSLLETDHYWQTGMVGWARLSQLRGAEEGRRKTEAEFKAKQVQAQLRAIQTPTKKDDRFRCNCCRAAFAKPTAPGFDFFKGILCWFLALILGLTISLYSAQSFRSRSFEGGGSSVIESFLVFFGCLFVFGLVVVGVALVFSAVITSPRCPLCRSTNFGRPDRSE